MRSYQKKLTATAAAAALLAAIGAALAQSPSADDLNSATANRNQAVSQGSSTKVLNGADMSTNGPLTKRMPAAPMNTTATTPASVEPAPAYVAPAPSTDNTSMTPAAAPADKSMPAPRADRN